MSLNYSQWTEMSSNYSVQDDTKLVSEDAEGCSVEQILNARESEDSSWFFGAQPF
jgi:hypothetical protein